MPILRRTQGARHRPFRVPAASVTAGLGILSCLALMVSLPPETWLRLAVWLAIGLAIFFGYGRRHVRPMPEPPSDGLRRGRRDPGP